MTYNPDTDQSVRGPDQVAQPTCTVHLPTQLTGLGEFTEPRRNYSGDDATDIHPIMVTSGGITAAMMQRIFTRSW